MLRSSVYGSKGTSKIQFTPPVMVLIHHVAVGGHRTSPWDLPPRTRGQSRGAIDRYSMASVSHLHSPLWYTPCKYRSSE